MVGVHEGALRAHEQEFELDLTAGTVTCPAGKVARISQPNGKAERTAHFRRSDCGLRPLKQRCTKRDRRSIQIGRREDLLQAARLALEDPNTAEHLRRCRPRIERLLGLIAHRYGARKARYIGAAKARLQALWTAALVNLNPIGRRLVAEAA